MFDLKKDAEQKATSTGETRDEARTLPQSESPEGDADLAPYKPVPPEVSVDLMSRQSEWVETRGNVEQPPPSKDTPPQKSNRLPETDSPRGGRPDQPGTHEARKLVIGREIVLIGEINSCDLLVVEGQVEATMKECQEIKITESGTFKGQVEFERADISGVFEGDLTAREHLVVRATGRVTGKVRFGELEIERGGQVIGDVQVFGAGTGHHSNGAADKPSK